MVFLPALSVDAYRDNAHVLAVYVFVQPYDIGLVHVTELFHELLR